MIDMNGKVVIVSGATGGRRREVRLLAECGAQVVFGGRNEENGRVIEADLHGRAVCQRHDLGSEAEWAAIVERAEQTFGKVTGLVNNAGVTITGKVTEIEAETVMAGIRTNQLGQLLGMKHVVPAMRRAKGGAIVNIGSEAGVRGAPMAIAYSGTKAAIACMTRTAAAELASDGIRVNLVNPGPIDTPMIRDVVGKVGAWAMGKNVPLGRIGKSEDVASAVVFLLSDDAGFITGAELNIDGGRTVAPARLL
jgi:3alpha(or 20beta)-hydroxysteroid dehydrogenase